MNHQQFGGGARLGRIVFCIRHPPPRMVEDLHDDDATAGRGFFVRKFASGKLARGISASIKIRDAFRPRSRYASRPIEFHHQRACSLPRPHSVSILRVETHSGKLVARTIFFRRVKKPSLGLLDLRDQFPSGKTMKNRIRGIEAAAPCRKVRRQISGGNELRPPFQCSMHDPGTGGSSFFPAEILISLPQGVR